ncbi:alpha/beta fold hydrolase [Actinoplanes sp. KI2]|uniref:thioesterase II family protein n=1 Tax=Actinoplanes sp. KI2 TaxID=2983315 RepID=UPI0021D58F15|nr:alpha/beta fold hydrolase [Actinoplanes sp. KI2]MCU7728893.1 alpha/beta fold hydrolase [Actinoplanes sp. KI2]
MSLATDSAALWLRRFSSTPAPRLRLICFAHAGGGPSAYRTWHERLPTWAEVVAVRYPGRQDRLLEPCIDRMEPLADAVAHAVRPLLDRPVVLFGHSMGAWVGYEVARRLRARWGMEPAALVMSGQVPPGRRSVRSVSGDEDLIAEVRRLGGADESMFDEPELLELVLPPIRADFALIDAYRPEPAEPFSCPLLVCSGAQDADVPPEAAAAWAATTTGPFRRREFPGGHFYLTDDEPALLGELGEWLASVTTRR